MTKLCVASSRHEMSSARMAWSREVLLRRRGCLAEKPSALHAMHRWNTRHDCAPYAILGLEACFVREHWFIAFEMAGDAASAAFGTLHSLGCSTALRCCA